MYFKKLQKVITIATLSALIAALIGFWLFEINWPFLPFPLLAGMAMTFIQKETISYKFLDKLFIGALFFGFLTSLFIFTRTYLVANFIFHSDFPFWPLSNPQEYLTFSLIFAFVAFLGGLTGIVLKGFYTLIKNNKTK
ncbi:MAG TPA: hypothetical protein P5267_00910 [Patescibacteria group bacterium]|nr:hypothetical protein [Patescibacteria group bacterium]